MKKTVLILLALAACSDPLGVPRDTGAPIQTDALDYDLTRRGLFLETSIAYVYANAGTTPIYVQNCGGAYGILLEQLQDGVWNVVWGNATPDCISPAIEIAPGQSLSGTLPVVAGTPDCGCGAFTTSEIDGVYRMVVAEAFDALGPNGYAAGELVPLDRRSSNRFVITR